MTLHKMTGRLLCCIAIAMIFVISLHNNSRANQLMTLEDICERYRNAILGFSQNSEIRSTCQMIRAIRERYVERRVDNPWRSTISYFSINRNVSFDSMRRAEPDFDRLCNRRGWFSLSYRCRVPGFSSHYDIEVGRTGLVESVLFHVSASDLRQETSAVFSILGLSRPTAAAHNLLADVFAYHLRGMRGQGESYWAENGGIFVQIWPQRLR